MKEKEDKEFDIEKLAKKNCKLVQYIRYSELGGQPKYIKNELKDQNLEMPLNGGVKIIPYLKSQRNKLSKMVRESPIKRDPSKMSIEEYKK